MFILCLILSLVKIQKVNRSECDHLLLIPANGGRGTVINRQRPLAVKAKSSTCFALRGERFASSSRLMGLSLLGYKDGTRTIEMILVSTVLTVIDVTGKSNSSRNLPACGIAVPLNGPYLNACVLPKLKIQFCFFLIVHLN